ncbi:MAG: SagB/ThcOx family dehydrogenase [Elusimicrobiota bacterium]
MRIEEGRFFLSNRLWDEEGEFVPDQKKGVERPPFEKKVSEDAHLVELPDPHEVYLKESNLFKIIENRRSRRKFTNENISLNELSYLLWITQGVQKILKNYVTFRTVPSAGARHPFETYIHARLVADLEKGIYRYLPLEHKLVKEQKGDFTSKIVNGANGQRFVGECAATFIWTVLPYRTEWRYHIFSHKMIAMDAGHVMQNLYLGCESLGLGTCAIGAYSGKGMDRVINVDGTDEFVIYVAPVGYLERKD